MSEHLSKEQMALYHERRISALELMAVDNHLADCDSCRHEVATLHDLNASLSTKSSVAENSHLSYEQLEAYIDGKLPVAESKVILAHTKSCRMCAEELRDLQSFREELVEMPAPMDDKEAGRWNLAAWFTMPRLTAPLAAALILIAILFLQKYKDSHNIHVAVNATPIPTTTPPANALASLQPEEQQAIQAALEQQRLVFPATLKELSGGQETLMGISTETKQFAVSRPVGEVVYEAQPAFHWKPLKEAISYTVTVFDTKLNPVESSPALRDVQWKSTRALDRGRIYVWQVSATLNDGTNVISPQPPNPEARFQVLSQAKADEFGHYRQAHPDEHFTLGILYSQAGMLDAGEDEFKQVPSNDPAFITAHKFLVSIELARHDKPTAAATHAAASQSTH